MKEKKSEKGLLSLEASISVTIFIFFVLFLYSFFIVFEARNEMAHVLLATTNSLALDPYEKGKLTETGNMTQVFYAIYGFVQGDSEGFISNKKWDNTEAGTGELNNAIRERFVAYLASGDTEEANKILKRYHIVGGVEGLDFSNSCIAEGNLHVILRYTLEYEYNMWNLGQMEFEQSACSKLWK